LNSSSSQNISDRSYSQNNVEAFDLENFESIQDYFDYYERNYNFSFGNTKDILKTFENLAKYMKWSKRHSHEKNKLLRNKTEQKKQDYMKKLFKKNGINDKYDDSYSAMENFYYLSKKLAWDLYRKRREDFDLLIERLTKKRLTNIEDLHEIIRKYQKLELLLPETIKKCQKFIKKHLFVNIYDFIEENDEQFENLRDLRKYTIENDKIYPLKDAKEDAILSILLKQFFARKAKN